MISHNIVNHVKCINNYLIRRFAINKIYSLEEAVKDIKDGSTILSSGFGICGIA